MEDYIYPWLRQMTIKQLRGFDAILDAKSITGAAKNLHLTPPAVSLQLKDLEATIGIPLVEQSNTGYIATQGGYLVQELSDKIRTLLNEYGEALNELSGIDKGHASIGVVNPARYFMPNLLVKYKNNHPNIKLRLNVGNRETIISQLEILDLDMAFMGRPPEDFAVECKTIGDHPQVIIAPANHELSGKLQLSLSKLKNQDFLLREVGSGTRTVADKLFKQSNFTPKSAVEFGSNETIKQAVIAGMGIAIMSAHTVEAEIADKRLITLDVKGLPVNRKWYIVKHKNKRLTPSSLELWDYVVQFGKDFLPKDYLV